MDVYQAYQQIGFFERIDVRTAAHRAFINGRAHIVRRGVEALRRFAGKNPGSRVGLKMAAANDLESRLEAVLAK
jgi:hypothetical protein